MTAPPHFLLRLETLFSGRIHSGRHEAEGLISPRWRSRMPPNTIPLQHAGQAGGPQSEPPVTAPPERVFRALASKEAHHPPSLRPQVTGSVHRRVPRMGDELRTAG